MRKTVVEATARVTIRYDDGTDQTLVYACDDCSVVSEVGYSLHWKLPSTRVPGKVPNGQSRVLIKLWGGMAGFDDLVQEAIKAEKTE